MKSKMLSKVLLVALTATSCLLAVPVIAVENGEVIIIAADQAREGPG